MTLRRRDNAFISKTRRKQLSILAKAKQRRYMQILEGKTKEERLKIASIT